ncbi:MAG: Hsp20/alpha crystallin family protein [Candidatus Omnitrophota bacterium]
MKFLSVRQNEDPVLTDVRFPAFFEDFFEVPMLFGSTLYDRELAIDVYEEKTKIIAKAELPGVNHEDIKLNIEGDLLKISGEKKQETEIKREDYYQSQTRYGKFQRTIQLPAVVEAEKVKATFKNGVLKVEMPKAELKQSKDVRIEIE